MTKKLISFLLSIATAFLSLFLPATKTEAPKDTSTFAPVIRFAVFSDTHVLAIGDTRSRRLQKVLSLAYSDAEQDENYKAVDAALIAGDLTDNGTIAQYIGFKATVDSVLKDETVLMPVVAKNHDGYTYFEKAPSVYENITGLNSDFHNVVNGFHFIGISASKTKGEHYSEYQREWLKEQLAAAASDDPEKPIFVIHHEHVSGTVYGSRDEDGWGLDYFKDILCEYPQIVDFSGHSHYPINDPRSIWQGEFTAVGTGTLKYVELTVDGKNRVNPDRYKKIAQMWIVEVDKNNSVRLRAFDALSATLLCESIIDNPSDKNNRQYSYENRLAESSAPKFSDNAELTVKKVAGKYKVTAPKAESTDGNVVFLYRIYVYGRNGELTACEYELNNFWLGETYENVTFKVKADKGSVIKVVAENAYGMQSDSLSVQLA